MSPVIYVRCTYDHNDPRSGPTNASLNRFYFDPMDRCQQPIAYDWMVLRLTSVHSDECSTMRQHFVHPDNDCQLMNYPNNEICWADLRLCWVRKRNSVSFSKTTTTNPINLPRISIIAYPTAETALWRCHGISILWRRWTNWIVSVYRYGSRIIRTGTGVTCRIDITFWIVGYWTFEGITLVVVTFVVISFRCWIIIDAFLIWRTAVVSGWSTEIDSIG